MFERFVKEARQAVVRAMRDRPWADRHFTFVDVKDGVVTFSGFVRDERSSAAWGVKDVAFETQPTPRIWIGAP